LYLVRAIDILAGEEIAETGRSMPRMPLWPLVRTQQQMLTTLISFEAHPASRHLVGAVL
jgi:hypothetical protein